METAFSALPVIFHRTLNSVLVNETPPSRRIGREDAKHQREVRPGPHPQAEVGW